MNSSPDERPEAASGFSADLDHLRQVPFFSSLPLEALKVLAYLGTHEVFREGEYLFRQGDDDGRSYLLLSGRAMMARERDKGEMQLSTFTDGAFIGSLSLLAPSQRLFSLRAEDRTECLCLTREQFLRTMERFPDMVPAVLEAVVRCVVNWEDRTVLEPDALCELCRKRLGVSLV